VRRLFDAQKAGHGGTLDPLATGVLPIALGEATKTVGYVMEGPKNYRFTLRWGVETETDDAEGRVVAESEQRPDRAAIEAVLPRFIGRIRQVPPRYSAIKVEGERAYDLARAEEDFDLAAREVEIDAFRLVSMDDADHATFEVECGKGAYMRALARDLGRALGGRAHIVSLRRTAVGPFTEDDAISLDSLEALGHSPAAFEQLMPVEAALDDIPALTLTVTEAASLRQGQPVSLLSRARRDRLGGLENGDMIRAMAEGKLVALARFEAGAISPVRVMNI
jgi:tRNA pseudouridine55 synthase